MDSKAEEEYEAQFVYQDQLLKIQQITSLQQLQIATQVIIDDTTDSRHGRSYQDSDLKMSVDDTPTSKDNSLPEVRKRDVVSNEQLTCEAASSIESSNVVSFGTSENKVSPLQEQPTEVEKGSSTGSLDEGGLSLKQDGTGLFVDITKNGGNDALNDPPTVVVKERDLTNTSDPDTSLILPQKDQQEEDDAALTADAVSALQKSEISDMKQEAGIPDTATERDKRPKATEKRSIDALLVEVSILSVGGRGAAFLCLGMSVYSFIFVFPFIIMFLSFLKFLKFLFCYFFLSVIFVSC